jgi:hypothetical protein
VTSLPDWLVERAALDEVAPASRARIDRSDPRELADRIAQLRDDNAAELAAHPPGAALALIESRIAGEERRRVARRRRARAGWLAVGSMAAAAGVMFVVFTAGVRPTEPAQRADVPEGTREAPEDTRAKGIARLVVFRQAGDHPERLDPDALVRPGDLVQLRYNAGGQRFGVIASIDGAGVVTLHYPAREDAPPDATALAAKPTALSQAYALDDAPRFERFFFITAADPVDVQQSLAALRSLAARADRATASLRLPAGVRQWSLRLRKPEHPPMNQAP